VVEVDTDALVLASMAAEALVLALGDEGCLLIVVTLRVLLFLVQLAAA
jgi:hypothetical protein